MRVEPAFDLNYEVVDHGPLIVLMPSDHRLTSSEAIYAREFVGEIFIGGAHKASVMQTETEDYLRTMNELKLCVVYADDDDLVRVTVTNLLIDAGVDVYACASGHEAIALCEQIEPDAVLLDLNMSGIDGLETARRIRGHPEVSATRPVAITARGTWDVRNKAMDAGFDELLIKPIATPRKSGAQLGARVAQCDDEWAQVVQNEMLEAVHEELVLGVVVHSCVQCCV